MKRIIAILIIVFTNSTFYHLHAQNLIVNKGDKYQITSILSTSNSVKRNDKQIDLLAVSTITKSYDILDANNDGYRIKITNTNITDTINSLGNQIIFNSNRQANAGSEIEMSLSKLLNSTIDISLDKTGKITKVDDTTKALQQAELASLTHVYNKYLVVGGYLNFGSAIKKPENAIKGTTWTEEQDGVKNSYTIKEINDKTTTFTYTSEMITDSSAMILNGLSIVDNATGVVLKRVNKISQRNLLSNGDKNFSHASDLTLAEVCNKIN